MIVGILGPGGCGGSFLDWSIQFLSGNKENLVVHVDQNNREIITHISEQQISNNPLINITAHGHYKTHPNSQSLPYVIDIFRNSKHPLNTFYYVDSMSLLQTKTNYNNVVKTYPDIKFLSYNFTQKHIDMIFYLQYEKIPTIKQQYVDQLGASLSNLNIKETREILSLYYPKCIKEQILSEQLDHANNLHMINFDDVWSKLDTVIFNVFDFLKLSVNQSLYPRWLDIYHTWIKNNNIDFINDLPKILDSIVNGKSLNLKKYNITFSKEAILSSKLLYNYNLALKFNDANDLTNNTLQWHSILEKNIYHDLKDTRI